MRPLKPRTHHHHVEHRLVFERRDSGGSGFSFPCDPQGKVDAATLPAAARRNYDACLSGLAYVRSVLESVYDYTEPAVGECDCCGREVVLDRFTNTCECGADYNGSGQLLAPREQWGEETGESFADILAWTAPPLTIWSHSDARGDGQPEKPPISPHEPIYARSVRMRSNPSSHTGGGRVEGERDRESVVPRSAQEGADP